MRRDDAWLLDMLLAARRAVGFAAPLTFPEFEDDHLHQLAILKAVETIGEAASRISQETKARHPEIPWTEIIGLRNRLVHAYFAIQLDIVWQIVQDDLPPLIKQLEPLVPPEPDGCPSPASTA